MKNDTMTLCKCEICGEIYGAIDTATIHKPLDGSQFYSKDPRHGYLPPWIGEKHMTFNYMRCPYGPHRPFATQDAILTVNGLVQVFDINPATIKGGDDSGNKEGKEEQESNTGTEEGQKVAAPATAAKRSKPGAAKKRRSPAKKKAVCRAKSPANTTKTPQKVSKVKAEHGRDHT